jgi:hypothetical protein
VGSRRGKERVRRKGGGGETGVCGERGVNGKEIGGEKAGGWRGLQPGTAKYFSTGTEPNFLKD